MALRRGEDRRPGRWGRVGQRLVSACVWTLVLLLAADAFAIVPSDLERTRTAIGASAYSVGEHYRATHALPSSLARLRRRRRHWDTTRDAWARPLLYRKDGTDAFSITSLGADGVPGGSGDDADIEVRYRIGATGWEEEIGPTDLCVPPSRSTPAR